MKLRKVLVTGGCGFIGSNFVRRLLAAHRQTTVVNLDALTYAGNPENLRDLEGDRRYRFVKGDVARREDVDAALAGGIEAVVHFAAESHVDRSILDAAPFLRTNVTGTQVLLEASREAGVERFVHVSTDEVYGSLGPAGRFTEESPLAPNSPYAASKAASDLLARAAWRTHGLPVVVTRASNNYGPYQYPEKLIPLAVTNALEGLEIPVYGDGRQVRDWLFVEDHCDGLLALLERGRPGEVYNLGGGAERENLEVVRRLLALLGVSESRIRFVPDRPGHDRRYALECAKAADEVGFAPSRSFEEGLAQTVTWYRQNAAWWRPLKERAFPDYARRWYGERLGSEGRFAGGGAAREASSAGGVT
jgi:dTDP-glucose 4,6-dehydratase